MTGIELKAALRAGQRVYGTLIVTPSPMWLAPVKSLGLDFVFIDTEHIALDREKLSWMCHAYREAGLAPVVRIPSPDPFAASRAIDGGAVGVVAPYIESATQVRQLVGAVKYRPLKGARLQELLAEADSIEQDLRDYLDCSNAGHLFIANIESRPAMEALDDILQVDELDGVLIGPHDLSCSLGIPEQYGEAVFAEAIEEIIRKARACDKGAGVHMVYRNGFEHEVNIARRGANLILHGADLIAFREAMRKDLLQIKAALGEDVEREAVEDINI